MMKRINFFSLVELLIVIGIIALLAGILLPVIVNSQNKAKVTQAKADMNSIKMALKAMENNYQKMVTVASDKATFYGNEKGSPQKLADYGVESYDSGKVKQLELGTDAKDSITAYNHFIQELSVPSELDKQNVNKRKLKLLDPRADYNYSASDGGDDNTLWRDPWGNPYIVLINTDYTDIIRINQTTSAGFAGTSTRELKLYGNVFVYSRGPNGKDNKGLNPNNGGDKMTDDINSWDK